jgi:hypothetical protein
MNIAYASIQVDIDGGLLKAIECHPGYRVGLLILRDKEEDKEILKREFRHQGMTFKRTFRKPIPLTPNLEIEVQLAFSLRDIVNHNMGGYMSSIGSPVSVDHVKLWDLYLGEMGSQHMPQSRSIPDDTFHLEMGALRTQDKHIVYLNGLITNIPEIREKAEAKLRDVLGVRPFYTDSSPYITLNNEAEPVRVRSSRRSRRGGSDGERRGFWRTVTATSI